MENPTYKIMIVDDDTFLLNMYSMKFGKNGFSAETSQSGEEALKKLKEGFVPNVMLVDVIMPGMDGLEFLEHVRKENLASNATVIMLTNQSDTADIEKAKSLKVNGYIVKATTVPSEVINEVARIHEEVRKSQTK